MKATERFLKVAEKKRRVSPKTLEVLSVNTQQKQEFAGVEVVQGQRLASATN
jgi:hypothetical protein